MIGLFCFALAVLASPFKSKLRLEAENAVLRHQLIVLRRLCQEDTEQPDHPASLGDSITASYSDEVFGTHTARVFSRCCAPTAMERADAITMTSRRFTRSAPRAEFQGPV